MKRTLTTIITLILSIASLSAVQLRVGYAYNDNESTQVCPYADCGLYVGRLLFCDGEAHKIVNITEGNCIQIEEVPYGLNHGLDVELNDSRRKNMVASELDIKYVGNFYTPEMMYIDGGLSLGVDNNSMGMYLTANFGGYNTEYGNMEAFVELGGTAKAHGMITRNLSIEAELSGYVYPLYIIENTERSTAREDMFSTFLYGELKYESKYFNAYIGGGLKSWQRLKDSVEVKGFKDIGNLVGGFLPYQIRNIFKCGLEVGTENYKLFADYSYFCDHPEQPWEHTLNRKGYTNQNYGIFTVGIGVNL